MSETIKFTREAFQRLGSQALRGNATVHVETPTPAVVISAERFSGLVKAASEATGEQSLSRRLPIVTLGNDWTKFSQSIAGWSGGIFGVQHDGLRIVGMPKWQHDVLQRKAAPPLAAN